MYESFFELRERPFISVPRPDHYFPGAAIEEARTRLARCIERAEGPALLVGGAGTGKTLLCQVLANQFQSALAIAHLTSVHVCSRRALLQAIMFELGLPYREMAEGELRLSLIDRLSARDDDLQGMLLLVDEAHCMPLALLEEIRMITNLVRDGQPRVRLVLAGLAALEERFAHPRLDCFSQRLAARCYLTPLDQGETARYIQAQIAGSEGDPDSVFAADALAAVHSATDGVPRLINQLCDHALLMASAGGVRQLTAAAVEEAWADLQQLPAPWCAASGSVPQAGENVIEFGGLDGGSDVAEEPETDQTMPIAAAEPELELGGVSAAEPAWSAAAIDEQQPDQRTDDEADFEPAGSIGPEVELVLGGHPNPFAESFDDEEVVIDQYAVLEENVFNQQPQVAARGDATSLHLLRQLPNLDQRPSLSLASTADDADERWSATGPETAITGSESDASGHAPELSAPPDLGPPERAALDDGADPAADGVPADHDLIIVTDDAEEDQPTAAVTTVRAQQYRQLFAQLRRG